MKLHLFESFQNTLEGIYPLGQVSHSMIPNDQESLGLLNQFLKKVVYQTECPLEKGFSFEGIDDEFKKYIVTLIENYFTGCEISEFKLDIIPDYAAIRHNKFNNKPIPYLSFYITNNQIPVKEQITMMICEGPFIFITFHHYKWSNKGNCWEYYYNSKIEAWEAYGFFYENKLDLVLKYMSQKFFNNKK